MTDVATHSTECWRWHPNCHPREFSAATLRLHLAVAHNNPTKGWMWPELVAQHAKYHDTSPTPEVA